VFFNIGVKFYIFREGKDIDSRVLEKRELSVVFGIKRVLLSLYTSA
jgi:hypothetical protein